MRFAALLFVCIIAPTARAVTIVDTPPPGLAPGTVYQRLFVTAVGYPIGNDSTYPPAGGVGGLHGADYNVTLEAYQSGRIPDWDGSTISFHAILSDGTTNARDRLTIAGPIFNMASELIATDAADLWDGSLANHIRYDEFGDSVPEGTRVWTGSLFDGSRDSMRTCGSWLSPGSSGRYGNATSSTAQWINQSFMTGDQSARLYALSPALIVPQPGDFSGDGTADAADFVAWRKNNRPPSDYDLWRTHFGESLPPAAATTTSIPEPPALLLAATAALILLVGGTDFRPVVRRY